MSSGLKMFLYFSLSIFLKVVSSFLTEMYYSPFVQLFTHSNSLQHVDCSTQGLTVYD